MNERERAVDNLITKARYAAGVYAVLPPESRKPHEHDLKVAVDHFLEVDAIAAPGLRFGCSITQASVAEAGGIRHFSVNSPTGTHFLYGYEWFVHEDDTRNSGSYSTYDAALTALASAPPPPGEAKGRYSVEDYDSGPYWLIRKRGSGAGIASVWYHTNGGKEESHDIALFVRDALEARNA